MSFNWPYMLGFLALVPLLLALYGVTQRRRRRLLASYGSFGLAQAGAGRKLGFPTANLQVAHEDKLIPHEGIYAVRAALRDRTVDGVLHLGPRPTFPGLPPSIELHLFDFAGDLYGARVRVDFVARIRDVAKFDSARALVRAMDEDVAKAMDALGANGRERVSGGGAERGSEAGAGAGREREQPGAGMGSALQEPIPDRSRSRPPPAPDPLPLPTPGPQTLPLPTPAPVLTLSQAPPPARLPGCRAHRHDRQRVASRPA